MPKCRTRLSGVSRKDTTMSKSTKAKLAVVILLLVVALASSQQSKTSTQQTGDAGRFSLISAPVAEGIGGGTTERTPSLFVIDTRTGRIWRWFPDTEVPDANGSSLIPARFEVVPFVKYGDGSIHQVKYPQ